MTIYLSFYIVPFIRWTCSVIRGYSQEIDMGLVLLYVVTVRNLTWDLFCYTWLQSGILHETCSVIRGYSQEFDMGLVLLYVVTVRNLTWTYLKYELDMHRQSLKMPKGNHNSYIESRTMQWPQ